ncbi:MAG: PepSY domain-containing protein [Thiobacillus sp.]|uniref:PepSY domain-containing protein n=1 Tax=Thiobacillus sp. TaxID=924 RepID=UPI0028956647|nr:PepSY domain-containing protein [Thiobacillus sp.]MDT3706412.1 PepSY domain-containing protein [Thiobacillus sp.]
MLRRIHSLPGLIVALLLAVLALTGAILSVDPAMDRLGTRVPDNGQISVATLADRVARHYPGVEQIQRSPSGSVIVYYSRDGRTGAERIDPLSGQGIGSYAPSAFTRWVKKLHRSLLAGTPGQAVAGVSALAMLALCLSGMALLARRVGGWRQLARPLRGNFSQRWHAELGRLALAGLLVSAVTGLYMSAATFGLVADGMQNEPDFPTAAATGPAAPIGTLPALLATDLNDLRELVYPSPGNPEDFYSLRTAQGDGYVDQATGALLSYRAHDGVHRAYELIYQLHTGEGLWWLGLFLGLSVLSVPLMGVTGVSMWWQRRRSMPRIADNSGPQSADTVILVGSEGNSTWGFAKALHDALRQAGQRVHTAPMNQLATEYRQARHLFILTSTYGDGDAPASANRFLARLDGFVGTHRPSFAVLGFGDRQFPKFCQFARDTQDALLERGWHRSLDLGTVDRQSAQAFAQWGQAVGQLFGRELTLAYTPTLPPTQALELIDRIDYGAQVQAPTSILRFGPIAPQNRIARLRHLIGLNGLPRFEAGDLVGIVPPGSPVPRFYSLASGAKDGFLEICVRKQPGGLCSQMLHGLKPGERIEVFIRSNPDFRPASGKSSVILIGAGAGIGPLAGFIRNNTGKYPMYLYWGGRDPASDFLYEPELGEYLADRRLTQLHAVFSRVKEGAYVQDRVLDNASQMRRLIENGAQILVCGSRAMAGSIMQAMEGILSPIGLDVRTLKLQGRYREDVY